jgi:hypothetical protein
MITLLQVFVVAFAVFAVSRAFLRFKDRRISALSFALWCAVWIAAIVVVIIPATSVFFANLLGIQRGADFVVYVSIVVLFYLLFRLYVKIDTINQNVTRLVREVAIRGKNKGK